MRPSEKENTMLRVMLISAWVGCTLSAAHAGPPERARKAVAKELAAKVTLQVDNATLQDVARKLSGQSELTVGAADNVFNYQVTIDLEDTPLVDVLDTIVWLHANDQLDWDVRGRSILFVYEESNRRRYVEQRVHDLASLLVETTQHANTERGIQSLEVDVEPAPSGGSIFDDIDDDDDDHERRLRYERASQIMNILRSGIEPDRWLHAGGRWHAMALVEDSIVVDAPAQVHERIQAVLGELDEELNQTIGIDARLLAVKEDTLDAILDESVNGPVLDEARVKQLLRPDDGAAKPTRMARILTTAAQAQHITGSAGIQGVYTSDVEPVVSDHAAGYDPQIGSYFNGLTVEIQPAVTTDGGHVVMAIVADVSQAQAGERGAMRGVVAGGTVTQPDQVNGAVDEETGALSATLQTGRTIQLPAQHVRAEYAMPTMQTARFRARARVPDRGGLVLVSSSTNAQLVGEDEVLVLLVRPRIVRMAGEE